MNPQEKELLTTLLARLKNTPQQSKDPEADGLIRQAVAEQPDLPYYLVQTVLIQDLSLHKAQQRIADLERQLADAQQSAKPVIGVLDVRSPGTTESLLRAFRQGLKETGYVEGENVALEYRTDLPVVQRANLSWSSTYRPPGCSGSPSQTNCSPRPTR